MSGADDAWSSRWSLAAALVLLGGAALRIWLYAEVSPLRVDEVRLVLNVLERSPAELARPLAHGQGAPLGQLLSMKAAAALLGPGELALRLPALLAGLAVLALFPVVARGVLGHAGALAGALLIAVSPRLALWSADAKQYSLDALATLVVLAAAVPAVRDALTPRRALVLVAAGALALVLSHPAAFVVAGAGLALLLAVWRRAGGPQAGEPRRVVTVGAGWVLALALLYFLHHRHLIDVEHLTEYWARDFLPLDSPAAALGWLPGAWREICIAAGLPVLAVTAMAALGAIQLGRTRAALLALTVGPLALAVVASAFEVYPFAGRMLTFAVPLLVLLAGAGFDLLARLLPGRGAWLALLPLALVAQPAVSLLLTPSFRRDKHWDVPAALAHVRAGRASGDAVHAEGGLAFPYLYYAPRYGLAPGELGRDLFDLGGEPRAEVLASILAAERTWVLMRTDTFLARGRRVDLRPRLLDELKAHGRVLETRDERGLTLYLFERRGDGGR